MPPELFKNGKLTKKTDIYSFGIFMIELIKGRRPFLGNSTSEIVLLISHGAKPEIPEGVPKWFHNLLLSCLDMNYQNRPDIDDIIHILNFHIKNNSLDIQQQEDKEIHVEEICNEEEEEDEDQEMGREKENCEIKKKINQKVREIYESKKIKAKERKLGCELSFARYLEDGVGNGSGSSSSNVINRDIRQYYKSNSSTLEDQN